MSERFLIDFNCIGLIWTGLNVILINRKQLARSFRAALTVYLLPVIGMRSWNLASNNCLVDKYDRLEDYDTCAESDTEISSKILPMKV